MCLVLILAMYIDFLMNLDSFKTMDLFLTIFPLLRLRKPTAFLASMNGVKFFMGEEEYTWFVEDGILKGRRKKMWERYERSELGSQAVK